MSIVYKKVQIEKNSTAAEIIGGRDPILKIDGKSFIRQDNKLLEVTIEDEGMITLDDVLNGDKE